MLNWRNFNFLSPKGLKSPCVKLEKLQIFGPQGVKRPCVKLEKLPLSFSHKLEFLDAIRLHECAVSWVYLGQYSVPEGV